MMTPGYGIPHTPAPLPSSTTTTTATAAEADADATLLPSAGLDDTHVPAPGSASSGFLAVWAARERALLGAERGYLAGYKRQLQAEQAALRARQTRWSAERERVRAGACAAGTEAEAVARLRAERTELDATVERLNRDIETYKGARASVGRREEAVRALETEGRGVALGTGAAEAEGRLWRQMGVGAGRPPYETEYDYAPVSAPVSAPAAAATSNSTTLDAEIVAVAAATAAAAESSRVLARLLSAPGPGPAALRQRYQQYLRLDDGCGAVWAAADRGYPHEPVAAATVGDARGQTTGTGGVGGGATADADLISAQVRGEVVRLLSNRSQLRTGLQSQVDALRGLGERLRQESRRSQSKWRSYARE
jgi:hypothetical protein